MYRCYRYCDRKWTKFKRWLSEEKEHAKTLLMTLCLANDVFWALLDDEMHATSHGFMSVLSRILSQASGFSGEW